VTLVVNPGWPCTDTSVGTFIVNNEISAFFTPPPAQCIIGNSYDFTGEGTFPATGSTFEWQFGSVANPTTSAVQNPTGIEYLSPGTHDVTFIVNFDQCHTSYTDQVLVAGPPIINFGIKDELRCAPYTANLINLSTASTPIYSFWDLGDGTTSTNTHPTNVYDVGVYDISLTIWTDAGCIDTLTMTRPGLIEVFPRPTSLFTVTPPEANEYEADFYFVDMSTDAVQVSYQFGDGYTETGTDLWHFYNDPGVYWPKQIVYNQYGCSDWSQNKITVTPVIPILVPNAFTPNGDSDNNYWRPVLYEDQVIELFIYDRWGELIHHTKELNAGWDGSVNGVLAEDGVYIYKIIYTDFKVELPVTVQGHIVLMK
jgi:gliding motility-associated-like protein